MADVIYLDCQRYSHKLIEKSCNCLLLVGSRRAVEERRKRLIASGMDPVKLAIVKTSNEQKNEYKTTKNSTVFMILENWR